MAEKSTKNDKNYGKNASNNNDFTTLSNARQRVALVFVNCEDNYDVEELCGLVDTVGGDVVITYSQNRPSFDTATLVGSGKLDEIAEGVKTLDIDVVVFNDLLTPTQHRNIQEKLDCIAIDRTNLILDIFAMRAKTAEGKLQVELAQLKYTLPKLRSVAGALTRQGGAGKSMGIGTRGPGETKLETDRRRVHEKIERVKSKLDEVSKQRAVLRANRTQSATPIIALVGYTNAGKSTLFNRLTNSNILAEDKLFATLDTTVRKAKLSNGLEVLFTDTVGFIRNLPHDLIEAFKSTLEETTYADIVLNVCDSQSNQVDLHKQVTLDILSDLHVTAPVITVYNKVDLLKNSASLSGSSASSTGNSNSSFDNNVNLLGNSNGLPYNSASVFDNSDSTLSSSTIFIDNSTNPQPSKTPHNQVNYTYKSAESDVNISALTGKGIDNLLKSIENELSKVFLQVRVKLPYAKSNMLQTVNKYGQNVKLEYVDNGIMIDCIIHNSYLKLFNGYLI